VFQTNGYLIINKNELIRCEEYIADKEDLGDSSEKEEVQLKRASTLMEAARA
jgi:hypothetical protein